MALTRGWARKIEGIGPLLRDYDQDEDPGGWPRVRDAIVAILKTDPAYTLPHSRFNEFKDAVEAMDDAGDPNDFDEALEDLYDWADEYRVWIDPLN